MFYSLDLFQESAQTTPLSKFLAPILIQIGFGGIVGYGLGFLLKKLGKVIVVFLGLAFISIQILIYYGYIPSVDWMRLSKDLTGAVDKNILNALWNLIVHNLPFASSFTVGFFWGLKKG